jgi:hypothetical protein
MTTMLEQLLNIPEGEALISLGRPPTVNVISRDGVTKVTHVRDDEFQVIVTKYDVEPHTHTALYTNKAGLVTLFHGNRDAVESIVGRMLQLREQDDIINNWLVRQVQLEAKMPLRVRMALLAQIQSQLDMAEEFRKAGLGEYIRYNPGK